MANVAKVIIELEVEPKYVTGFMQAWDDYKESLNEHACVVKAELTLPPDGPRTIQLDT